MKKNLSPEQLRKTMIESAVRDLQKFGYPSCTTDNIISDEVYSQFFRSQLQEALRTIKNAPQITNAITSLLEEIDKNND